MADTPILHAECSFTEVSDAVERETVGVRVASQQGRPLEKYMNTFVTVALLLIVGLVLIFTKFRR
jgi:hypothetical protein